MHRTIGDSYGLDAGKRIFRQENSPSWQATQVTYDSMNALQEEIAHVIEAEGLTLNVASESIGAMTQLNTAINQKVAIEAAARNAAILAKVPDFLGYASSAGLNFWTDLGALTVNTGVRMTLQKLTTPKVTIARVSFWFDANVSAYKWVAWEVPAGYRPTSSSPQGNGIVPATCIHIDSSATPTQLPVQDIYATIQRGTIGGTDRNVVMFGNAELMTQNTNQFPSQTSFPIQAAGDFYTVCAVLFYERH